MPDPDLTYDDLRRIVELINSSAQFSEFRLKVGAIEIELRRRKPEAASLAQGSAGERVETSAPLPPAPPPRAASSAGKPDRWPEGVMAIRSPMVGTFYRAPVAGDPPFVEVGQRVEADTTVCIIEVMKLMNSIPAGARGVVVQVLAGDATLVDIDQPLMLLRPD